MHLVEAVGAVCLQLSKFDALSSYPDVDHEPSFIAETSFVRAPLNSRVGTTSFSPKNKGKGKEDVLNHLPVDLQEALILEDLLYVMMVSS